MVKRDIDTRTFEFAVRVVKLCRFLDKSDNVARTISHQILRSATSIGANVEEAQAGQSKPDFISKMSIALKEARETLYWLRILEATDFVSAENIAEIKQEASELTRILAAIIVSAKQKPQS
ncbi:MAG: four helix bundle protein [Pyrinomonadaceae bacterium]|nr:four helix bundle protein [Pyrinomonadaceae bacterium]